MHAMSVICVTVYNMCMVATFCCLAERFVKFKHPVIYLITSKVATNDLCVDRLYS